MFYHSVNKMLPQHKTKSRANKILHITLQTSQSLHHLQATARSWNVAIKGQSHKRMCAAKLWISLFVVNLQNSTLKWITQDILFPHFHWMPIKDIWN